MTILGPLGHPMEGQSKEINQEEMNAAIGEVAKALANVAGIPFDVVYVAQYKPARDAMDMMIQQGVPYAVIPAKIDATEDLWVIVYPRPFGPTLRSKCGWVGEHEASAEDNGREQPGNSPGEPGPSEYDSPTVPWEERGKIGGRDVEQGHNPD